MVRATRILMLCLVAVAGALHGNLAFSQVYFGATAGASDSSSSFDDAPEFDGGTGYRIYLGNQVSETFSVELAYYNSGDYDVLTLDGLPDANEVSDVLFYESFGIAFVGKWPVFKRLSLFGRVGGGFWEVEREITREMATEEQPQLIQIFADDGSGFTLGAGIDYRIWKHVGFTLEYNFYETGSVSNGLAGAGFYFTF